MSNQMEADMRFAAGLLVALAIGAALVGVIRVRAEPATDQVTAMIYEAAAYYGTDGDWLYAVAMCETGGTLRSDLVGRHGERGVFQWLSGGQWLNTPRGRAGYPIPAGDLVGDIYMAAWSFANGYARAWSCA
jgi:hypothetical protein